MRRSVNVLRIGNPLRMSDEMLDCSYERRYSAHPDYHELWNIRKELRGDKGEVKGERKHKLQQRRSPQRRSCHKIRRDLFRNICSQREPHHMEVYTDKNMHNG